jgi:hypothetical protein
MIQENARVLLQDGSRAGGLLERTGEYLQGMGVSIAGLSQASQPTALTTLIDHKGKPFTARFLVDLMGISPNKIIFDYEPDSPVDVEIILGDDWVRRNPLP